MEEIHLSPAVLEKMRAEWNQRAKEDAFYYVAFARRNQSEGEFDSTSQEAITALEMDLARMPPGDAKDRRALEIGCGPGRLMIPMSRHFGEIHGVDISEEMIRMARERLQAIPGAHPHVNSGADLAIFSENHFDYVYSYVVFQHIPSRDVVLNYLGEIARVLKPAGIARCQYRGAPAFPGEPGREPDSWNGCSFTSDEVMERAAAHGLEVHALSGESTQYMWLTFRKRTPAGQSRDLSRVTLNAVTAAHGAPAVPERGPYAALSLWIDGVPDGCDLNNLRVDIGGRLVRGIYLGPLSAGGGCQFNAMLPAGVPTGAVAVTLVIDGEAMTPARTIEITAAPPRAPRVVRMTDGINLLSEKIACDAAQLTMVDIANPALVTFAIDGKPAELIDCVCADTVLEEYMFSIRVPVEARPRKHRLTIRVDGAALPDAEFETV